MIAGVGSDNDNADSNSSALGTYDLNSCSHEYYEYYHLPLDRWGPGAGEAKLLCLRRTPLRNEQNETQ